MNYILQIVRRRNGETGQLGANERAGLKVDLKEVGDQIKELKKEVRQTGNIRDRLATQKKVRGLQQKREEAWNLYDDTAKDIEK